MPGGTQPGRSEERAGKGSAAEIAPGDVLAGKYRTERILGEGGMGVVWEATHLVTRKRVALKLLLGSAATNADICRRFIREARAASAVKHPNVVTIHDVIEREDGSPVLVMDLLEGESLASRLERERAIPLDELARLMLPVVSAVGTAHAAGIVHRDIKPDNIFLARASDGTLKVTVLDFGIAKINAIEGDGAVTGARTATGAVLGTPYYMAPEQIYGEKDIDHRADIWALGIVLYECLAGERPTQGDNIGQIFKSVTVGGFPPLSTAAPAVPADISLLVERMLRRERGERLADLHEVQAVLSRYSDLSIQRFGSPVMARPSGPSLPRASDPNGATLDVKGATVLDASVRTGADVQTSSDTRRRLLFAGAVVAVVITGLVIVNLVHTSHAARASMTTQVVATADRAAPHETSPEPITTPTTTEMASATPVVPSPSAAHVVPSSSTPRHLRNAAVVRVPSAHPSVAPTVTPAPRAQPSCDPPYFFNAQGYKVFKPECVQ